MVRLSSRLSDRCDAMRCDACEIVCLYVDRLCLTRLSLSLSLLFHKPTNTTNTKWQRPYLLQGHERPITVVKYNYDGDLLFTASKDQIPSVWRSENGERLGTFHGHKGTIWDLDVDRFSRHLLTASADA